MGALKRAELNVQRGDLLPVAAKGSTATKIQEAESKMRTLFLEKQLMMRALRDFNLAKIPDHDKPVFTRLINDLFPKTDVEDKKNLALTAAIQICCEQTQMSPDPEFFDRVVQACKRDRRIYEQNS